MDRNMDGYELMDVWTNKWIHGWIDRLIKELKGYNEKCIDR